MSGARLIHLNGPPGIGKTTLARRYAVEHPGVLLCDIDVLRTMIGGWQDDDGAAGRVRTAALALVTGYLTTGYDVVLPQLVARHDQLGRFAAAAREAGAEHIHVMLTTDPETVVRRFHARDDAAYDEWTSYATGFWVAEGGDAALLTVSARLDALPAVRVPSTDPETTYRALLVALGEHV
ncbi:AAA family ATPase [Nocardioides sp.]|jgi:predicted kinase|uniref:AAA family ATPase n=1 Tax=Nocardioides sp. TaxID=35761 RepID=UPI002F4273CD